MLCDFHVHTCLSADSEANIDSVIQQAIQLGMKHLCITDHHDIDFENNEFFLNPKSYYSTLHTYKEKYHDKINLLIGVEMGLQPHVKEDVTTFIESIPLDFVIGSTHAVDGEDPYYENFWVGKTTEKVMEHFFESTLENIKTFDNFDVYGHLDYAIRYAKEKDLYYSYEKYKNILDAILMELIKKGKGIELNTGGLRYGLRSTNPSIDIIRAYKKMGGSIITIGSDAHKPSDIGANFSDAKKILIDCGFDTYHIFVNREPIPCRCI